MADLDTILLEEKNKPEIIFGTLDTYHLNPNLTNQLNINTRSTNKLVYLASNVNRAINVWTTRRGIRTLQVYDPIVGEEKIAVMEINPYDKFVGKPSYTESDTWLMCFDRSDLGVSSVSFVQILYPPEATTNQLIVNDQIRFIEEKGALYTKIGRHDTPWKVEGNDFYKAFPICRTLVENAVR